MQYAGMGDRLYTAINKIELIDITGFRNKRRKNSY